MGNFDIKDSNIRQEYNGSNTKEVVIYLDPLKDDIKKKVLEYLKILRYTDNETQYFSTFKKLKSLIGGFDSLPDAVISVGMIDEDDNPRVICITTTKNNGARKSEKKEKIYHTSDIGGLKSLKATFRSKDRKWLYPDKRIYVSLNNPMGRDGGNTRAKYVYRITNDKGKDLKIDQDYQWSADKYNDQYGVNNFKTNSRYYTIDNTTDIDVKRDKSLFTKYSPGIYREMLEFFMENNVILNKDQLDKLKEICNIIEEVSL